MVPTRNQFHNIDIHLLFLGEGEVFAQSCLCKSISDPTSISFCKRGRGTREHSQYIKATKNVPLYRGSNFFFGIPCVTGYKKSGPDKKGAFCSFETVRLSKAKEPQTQARKGKKIDTKKVWRNGNAKKSRTWNRIRSLWGPAGRYQVWRDCISVDPRVISVIIESEICGGWGRGKPDMWMWVGVMDKSANVVANAMQCTDGKLPRLNGFRKRLFDEYTKRIID